MDQVNSWMVGKSDVTARVLVNAHAGKARISSAKSCGCSQAATLLSGVTEQNTRVGSDSYIT
jgi:hypothetical protein